MSNIKEVEIAGWLAYDGGQDAKLLSKLGQMQMPSFGLKIYFDNRKMEVPSEFGGKLTLYWYTIEGQEAVGEKYLVDLVEKLNAKWTGKVMKAYYRDIEEDTDWFNFRPNGYRHPRTNETQNL